MPNNAAQVEERRGREGGRWINERPTPKEFADWFKESMSIDPALNVEDYLGGVVLIPAVDGKAKYVSGFREGKPLIDDRPEMSYVPYAKVETRIAYFWDLLAAHEDEWVGVVEPVELPRLPVDGEGLTSAIEAIATAEGTTPESLAAALGVLDKLRPSALATMVHQLPPGFSMASIPVGNGYSHFVCCTIRVAIYRRQDYEADPARAVPIREGRGTKQVPLTKRGYQGEVKPDEASLMKAETGALGRALGFAGIFVIPGSGIATAEDMVESATQGDTPVTEAAAAAEGPAEPEQPPVPRTGAEAAQDDDAQLTKRALEIWKDLTENHPGKADEFKTWAAGRKLARISDAKGAMLRGVVKKLEKLHEEGEEAGQQAALPVSDQSGEGDGPAESSGPPSPSEG